MAPANSAFGSDHVAGAVLGRIRSRMPASLMINGTLVSKGARAATPLATRSRAPGASSRKRPRAAYRGHGLRLGHLGPVVRHTRRRAGVDRQPANRGIPPRGARRSGRDDCARDGFVRLARLDARRRMPPLSAAAGPSFPPAQCRSPLLRAFRASRPRAPGPPLTRRPDGRARHPAPNRAPIRWKAGARFLSHSKPIASLAGNLDKRGGVSPSKMRQDVAHQRFLFLALGSSLYELVRPP